LAFVPAPGIPAGTYELNHNLVHYVDIALLGQIEMLGTAERTSGEESFDMVVPPLKIRDFNFSSVTKF